MTEGNALEQFCGELAGGTGHWHMDTDVLVVGAGLAGHCATFEAASAGARVVLLEKRGAVGGSTVLSGGAMAFAGTDEQIANGIADSDARLRQDLFEVGERRSDERLIDAYARHQHETYRWLKTHGVEFHSVQLGGGQSVPRSNRVDTRQMIGALGVSAADTGRVTLRTNTAALRLIRSHADNRVEGAIVDSSGEMVSIRARTGVVLASGGFSRSEDLLISFAPAQAKALRIGGPGNVGDGMRMACALGAGLKDMGYVRGTFGTHPDTAPEELAIIHAIYKGAIAVNSAGRRFIDESVSYKLIGDACLQQPSALAFQIFDQGVMELSIAGVATSDFQAQLESGRLLRGSTLEELAGKAGINAEALISTVTAYNADVESGCDRVFGRDGLANHYGALRKIDWPPFYAYPSTSALLATYAGLHVDDAMQVRDVFGDVINGLFAAGEVIGGFHGAAYMTGSSLGKCAVFGRIAGLNAAKIGSRSN